MHFGRLGVANGLEGASTVVSNKSGLCEGSCRRYICTFLHAKVLPAFPVALTSLRSAIIKQGFFGRTCRNHLLFVSLLYSHHTSIALLAKSPARSVASATLTFSDVEAQQFEDYNTPAG